MIFAILHLSSDNLPVVQTVIELVKSGPMMSVLCPRNKFMIGIKE